MEFVQHDGRLLGVRHDGALGDLELEADRIDLPLLQELSHQAGQLRIQEVTHRQVDGDVQVESLPVPLGALTDGLVEDVARERLDQPTPLGDRDELAGRQDPAVGMLPADQSLDAATRFRRREIPAVGT